MVGFRSTTPLLTGNTQVAAMGLPSIPSVNPGFRMGNTNMPLPGLGFRAGPSVGGKITGMFGGGIDPNIFANYTPSYIPPPPPPPPPPAPVRRNRDDSGRDNGGRGGPSRDSHGRSYGDLGVSPGSYGGGGHSRRDDGGRDNGGGSSGGPGSGDRGDVSRGSWSTGGQIPPVYANQGEVMPTMDDLALEMAMAAELERQRQVEEAATAGTITEGAGAFDTVVKAITGESFFPDPISIGLTAYNVGNAIKEQGLVKGLIPDVIENIFKDDKEPDNPFKDSKPAFDFSPGNINPNTGQTMTPQTDTIPGGTRPSASISTYSPVDYESDFFADLQAEIAAFDANFKAEQEAKQQALEDAAKASAAAAHGSSTWGGGYDKEAYDKGGWGPDVGGYNDPGAFGGKMGSSPGDKSTW